jgi:PII-like signaling protein
VRGLQGFAASANLGRPGLAALTVREPVLIEVTDDAAKVRAFLPSVEQLAGGWLIVLNTVTTARRSRPARHSDFRAHVALAL